MFKKKGISGRRDLKLFNDKEFVMMINGGRKLG